MIQLKSEPQLTSESQKNKKKRVNLWQEAKSSQAKSKQNKHITNVKQLNAKQKETKREKKMELQIDWKLGVGRAKLMLYDN